MTQGEGEKKKIQFHAAFSHSWFHEEKDDENWW